MATESDRKRRAGGDSTNSFPSSTGSFDFAPPPEADNANAADAQTVASPLALLEVRLADLIEGVEAFRHEVHEKLNKLNDFSRHYNFYITTCKATTLTQTYNRQMVWLPSCSVFSNW